MNVKLATTLHDLVLCQYCRASVKLYHTKYRQWNEREDGTGNNTDWGEKQVLVRAQSI